MATAAMISTYALFGLGEAMLSPTVAPLVADLAPESMVGQYNSAFALVKQLALAVGPAVGGPMGAALHGPYIVTFVLFSLGITVLALKLGHAAHPRTGQAVARGGAVPGGRRVPAGERAGHGPQHRALRNRAPRGVRRGGRIRTRPLCPRPGCGGCPTTRRWSRRWRCRVPPRRRVRRGGGAADGRPRPSPR